MTRRPIKLDWEELEDAFSNQNEEIVYYLDLVTGHIVLEGEGEDGLEDDDDVFPRDVAATVPPAPRDDSTRAYVTPPDTDLKIEWMKKFVTEVDDLEPSIAAKLEQAVTRTEPVAAIKEVLAAHSEGRDRWYLYRSDRVRELIESWLADHSVDTVDGPPWK